MKRLAAALAVFGFLAAGPAQAEQGFYFGIGGGPSFLQKGRHRWPTGRLQWKFRG